MVGGGYGGSFAGGLRGCIFAFGSRCFGGQGQDLLVFSRGEIGMAFGLGMGWICLLGRQHLRVLHLHWVWERRGRSSEFKILNKH